MDQATQGLQSIQRFRERFDEALVALTALEVEDTVTVRDVVAVLQPAEQLVRTAGETAGRLVELGDDGQLLNSSSKEVTEGVDEVRALVLQDYLCPGPDPDDGQPTRQPWRRQGGQVAEKGPSARQEESGDRALEAMARLSFEDLLDVQKVATAIGVLPPEEI